MELTLKIKQEEGKSLKGEVVDWKTKYYFESPLEELFPEGIRNPEKAFEILKTELMKLKENSWFYRDTEYIFPYDEKFNFGCFHFTVHVLGISSHITAEEVDVMYKKIAKVIYEKFESLGTAQFRSFKLCPYFGCRDRHETDLSGYLNISVFPNIR